jgi:hypothetical protein
LCEGVALHYIESLTTFFACLWTPGGQVLYDAIKEQVDDGALQRGVPVPCMTECILWQHKSCTVGAVHAHHQSTPTHCTRDDAAFGLDPKVFYSSFTLLAIHVWLVIHRMSVRNDRDARFFKQRFYNHFHADVERRIYQAGVQVRLAVARTP